MARIVSIHSFRRGTGKSNTTANVGPASRQYRQLLLLLFIGFLTACAPQVVYSVSTTPTLDKLAEVVRRGTLIIATDPAYPPQSELLSGEARAPSTRCASTEYTANQMAGFDIEVALEISQRLGVEPCFVTPRWTQIIAGNWDGRWDISIGSMVITKPRMEALYFTQPYMTGKAALFVHRDNQSFSQPSDLSGKRVGTCTGCAYENYLRGALEIPGVTMEYQIENATIVGYDTDTSALEDLAAGDGLRLDAVLTDPDTGHLAIEKGLPVKQLGEAIYIDYLAAAIDKNSNKDVVSFVQKITELVQQMHQDGTLLKLSQQYYGEDFATDASQYDIQSLDQFP